MANNAFGAGGFGANDFEAVARQYWNSWGEMMRNAAASAPLAGMPGMPGMSGIPGTAGMTGMPGMGATAAAAMPGWNEVLAWWSKHSQGGGAVANDLIEQFNSQARGWSAQMQQVASQLAGQNASASDIAQAWKRALGGEAGNPFADMFRGMHGPGQSGFDQWFGQAAPYLQGFERWQRDNQAFLGQPTFGFTREHQQRWQQLAQAQVDYQQHNQAYNALMAEAAQDAFARFEQKLTERSEPGRQLESARALFDLWIDAAEEAYAEIALSPRFRDAYGALVNSQMRLRAGLQREIENATELLGIPSRTEVDAAHRKIVQLERELRRMRDAIAAIGEQLGAGERGGVASRAVRRPDITPSPQPAPGGRAGRSAAKSDVGRTASAARAKPSAKPAGAKKAAAAKAAVKQPAAKKTTAAAHKRVAAPAKRTR